MSDDVTEDPRRTVPAAAGDRESLRPGDDYKTSPGLSRRLGDDHLMFACPGCGRVGAIRVGVDKPPSPGWAITGGTLDDVTGLSLSPSIHCQGCCGWHGYLRNGTYESC